MHLYHRGLLRLVVTCLVLCAPCFANGQFMIDPTAQVASRVGTLLDSTDRPIASCLFVDERGYVATSFAAVKATPPVAVIFNSGNRFPVNGLVSSAAGKDIALLALTMRGAVTPLDLLTKSSPKIGEDLMTTGGPLAARVNRPAARPVPNANVDPIAARRAPGPLVMPKLSRHMRGDEFILGLKTIATDAAATDPDIEWLWLTQSRDRTCVGGAVYNKDGTIVGMLTNALDPSEEVRSAVHARHIAELLPKIEPKLQPLTATRAWSDPLPLATNIEEIDVDKPLALGGRLERALPLSERYEHWQMRLIQAERESAELDKQQKRLSSRNLEIASLLDRIAEKISRNFASGDDLSQQRRMQMELGENQVLFDHRSQSVIPLLEQTCRRLNEEGFELIDPLNLRPREDHEQFVGVLTEMVEEGGAPAMIYFARAMSRVWLKKYEGAAADLSEAVDIDASLKSLALLVEARTKLLQGENAAGNKALAQGLAGTKNDARALLLAARIELDRGNEEAALRLLQKSSEANPLLLESKLGIVWFYASSEKLSPKLAVSMAEETVRATAGRDWVALAAAAGAHQRVKRYDQAIAEIEAVVRLSPLVAMPQCRQWQVKIQQKQPIALGWK